MWLNALLHLQCDQHVSGTSIPIIRSSRLYMCYYRLWCALLDWWLSGVRCRAAGCQSRKRDVARLRRAASRCRWPATSWGHYTTSCNTQSSAPEDGQNNFPKHVELTGIINKPLLLYLVGCLCYLYQWCTIKQISDNKIYLLIKYIKPFSG